MGLLRGGALLCCGFGGGVGGVSAGARGGAGGAGVAGAVSGGFVVAGAGVGGDLYSARLNSG